ncbi:MAG TPA: hypothetical protein VFK05_12535 [Polyangiaceae bacterium]|nr:hypothetical protein [Polyangiaceae bacterium]
MISAFGAVEALFGLERLMFTKDIPASQHAQCIVVDPLPEVPSDWTLVYANMTPVSKSGFSFSELPRLLAPQNMHQTWSPHLTVFVPAGAERQINFSLVLRPPNIERVRDLALQACQNLHRHELGIASVLLCAAAEVAMRERLVQVYGGRGVSFDADKAGFSGLFERARMLLSPALGADLVGALKALAKEGRNPTAHGGSAVLTHDQVARWMVDVAILYEWTLHSAER